MTGPDFDLPWFPLWTADFLGSRKVRLMDAEKVGIYILLLCHQWEDGPIPDDDDGLSILTHNADPTDVRTVLERCFTAVGDGWVNERLERVRDEQVGKRMQKVRAGKASAKARRKSKRGKKKGRVERRSNGVATDVERTYQRSTNEPESESEEETTVGSDDPGLPPPGKLKKDDGGNYTYPEAFERMWAKYPTRRGSNPKKGAYRKWRGLVKDGTDPTELLKATESYAAFARAEGIEGQRTVMQAQTFFGPDEPWSQEWASQPNGNGRRSGPHYVSRDMVK